MRGLVDDSQDVSNGGGMITIHMLYRVGNRSDMQSYGCKKIYSELS